MSKTQKLFCAVYSGYVYCGLCLFWVFLEKFLYGAIQNRAVDNIVSIPIIISIYLMFKFKTERDNLKKGLKYTT